MDILDYYNGLAKEGRRKFRDAVMSACDIQYFTFNRKIKFNTWSKLEREAIRKIIDYGVDES